MRYPNIFVVIVPVGLSFGPMFMVWSGLQKYPSPIYDFVVGSAAAFALTCALGYIWRENHSMQKESSEAIQTLKKELDELKKHGSNDAV